MNKRRFHRAVDHRISAAIGDIPGFHEKPDAERWALIGKLTLRAVADVLKDASRPIYQSPFSQTLPSEGHSDE